MSPAVNYCSQFMVEFSKSSVVKILILCQIIVLRALFSVLDTNVTVVREITSVADTR